jgi:hypothetical protein
VAHGDYNPWSVRHFNHAGTALGEAFPQELAFSMFLGAKVGSITYELDLEQDLAVRGKTNPYSTDFKLYRGHETAMIPIMGGMHTSISIADAESNTLSVAGKDWMHWFELDEWPFNASNIPGDRYVVVARDIALIVKDILDRCLAEPNSLSFTYTLSAIGQTTNYKIEPADTEKILSKIDALSKLSPGFDIEITHDRVFKIHAPQRTRTLTGFALRQGDNMENLSYTDNGPKATRLRGFAQATTRIGYVYNSPDQAAYRRLMGSEEFTDVADLAALTSKTNAEGARAEAPTIEFSCSYVNYDDDINFWSQVQLGDKIHVAGDLRYDVIDDYFRLVGIECQPTDEGSEEIILTFDDGSLSL